MANNPTIWLWKFRKNNWHRYLILDKNLENNLFQKYLYGSLPIGNIGSKMV